MNMSMNMACRDDFSLKIRHIVAYLCSHHLFALCTVAIQYRSISQFRSCVVEIFRLERRCNMQVNTRMKTKENEKERSDVVIK